MPADIEMLCQRHSALKSDRSTWDSLCQELADVISPRKANITTHESNPSNLKEKRARNSTAANCNMTLAQGCVAYGSARSRQRM
jgi:Bacteriophage head to tail connecting protein